MRHLAVSETFNEEGFSTERCKWVASLLKKKRQQNTQKCLVKQNETNHVGRGLQIK